MICPHCKYSTDPVWDKTETCLGPSGEAQELGWFFEHGKDLEAFALGLNTFSDPPVVIRFHNYDTQEARLIGCPKCRKVFIDF